MAQHLVMLSGWDCLSRQGRIAVRSWYRHFRTYGDDRATARSLAAAMVHGVSMATGYWHK